VTGLSFGTGTGGSPSGAEARISAGMVTITAAGNSKSAMMAMSRLRGLNFIFFTPPLI
jgi:hypothetical protein